jgi:hypothetical protein
MKEKCENIERENQSYYTDIAEVHVCVHLRGIGDTARI